VRIKRIWRPRFRQAQSLGRLLNAIWMLAAWSLLAIRVDSPDVLIVGTDPIFSVLVALPWKLIRPRTKIVHWCFDLYPEAAVAEGALPGRSPLVAALRSLLRLAYRCCDLIVDIGPCMRGLLASYGSAAGRLTATPWAISEPARELQHDASERRAVCGDANLALMYSGNFGRAHSFHEVLSLARALRREPVRFAFSIRGNRAQDLVNSVSNDDENVRFVPFADESRLDARLSAADIHIVTLRQEWTGSVVPSKFFGALAAGRPVLFVGSRQSSIAIWINTHRVGWVLDSDNQDAIASELSRLARHPEELSALFTHCYSVYQRHFARVPVIHGLERELRRLISVGSTPAGTAIRNLDDELSITGPLRVTESQTV
jgi:colanic acid biosynthesis glycosyl transferase WcaI